MVRYGITAIRSHKHVHTDALTRDHNSSPVSKKACVQQFIWLTKGLSEENVLFLHILTVVCPNFSFLKIVQDSCFRYTIWLTVARPTLVLPWPCWSPPAGLH
jgi:hypothetical protein